MGLADMVPHRLGAETSVRILAGLLQQEDVVLTRFQGPDQGSVASLPIREDQIQWDRFHLLLWENAAWPRCGHGWQTIQ